MIQIQYRNDFLLRLRFEDVTGVEIAPPACDWEAAFVTSLYANAYTAMCVGGALVRARREADSLIIPFDNHGLMPGELTVTFTADIPVPSYPDGKAHICVKASAGVRLTDDHTCTSSVSTIITVTLRLPLFAKDLAEPEPDEPKEPTDGCDCGCGCNGGGESLPPATDDDISAAIDAAFDEVFPNEFS